MSVGCKILPVVGLTTGLNMQPDAQQATATTRKRAGAEMLCMIHGMRGPAFAGCQLGWRRIAERGIQVKSDLKSGCDEDKTEK
jgi:hypothetical protein